MVTLIDLYSNFTGGLTSPYVEGRVDLQRNSAGLSELVNGIPKPHGCLIRRSGTKFVAHTRLNAEAYLMEFVFSSDQAHILEFTDNVMRVYTNNSLVLKSSGSSDFVNGDFPTNIASWTDASTGASSIVHDAVDLRMQLICGATGVAEARQSIASLVPHQYTVTLDVVDSAIKYKVGTTAGASDIKSGTLSTGTDKKFRFYSGSNTTVHFTFYNDSTSTTAEIDNIALSASPYELATPWTVAELKESDHTQLADLLYITHNDHKIKELARTADDNWAISDFDYEDGPYLPENVSESYPLLSHPNAFFEITDSQVGAQTLTSTEDVFESTDVGRHLRLRSSTDRPFGWGKITGYTNAKTVEVTFESPVDGTADCINGTFDVGMHGWATVAGSPSWNSGSQGLDLNATNDAVSQRYICKYVNEYNIDVTKVSGAGTVQIAVGYSSSTDEVVTWTTITGTTTVTFTPEASETEVFINIKSTSNASLVDDIIVYSIPPASTHWRLGAWCDRANVGYPKCTIFYNQRLVFASSVGEPQTFWASQPGEINNFTPDGPKMIDDISESSAWNVTLGDRKLNTIHSMSAQTDLIFHTSGPIFVATMPDSGGILPTVTNAVTETSSKTLQPIMTSKSAIFIDASDSIVFDVAYDFASDGYNARQLTRLADQVTEYPFTSMTLQDTPDKTLWFSRSDGKLISLSYEKDEKVIAWAEHELAGTDVKCLQVKTIPANKKSQLWLHTERTIDGSTVRFIEYMEQEFRFQDQKDAFFLDCGATYIGEATTVIDGLDHLEGETVAVLRDGIAETNLTVTNGSVTIEVASEKVQVGINFITTIKTNDLEIQTNSIPTLQGQKTRIIETVVRLYETIGITYGYEGEETFVLPFQTLNDPMGVAIPMFTGTKRVFALAPHSDEGVRGKRFVCSQDLPYPLTLINLMNKVQLG